MPRFHPYPTPARPRPVKHLPALASLGLPARRDPWSTIPPFTRRSLPSRQSRPRLPGGHVAECGAFHPIHEPCAMPCIFPSTAPELRAACTCEPRPRVGRIGVFARTNSQSGTSEPSHHRDSKRTVLSAERGRLDRRQVAALAGLAPVARDSGLASAAASSKAAAARSAAPSTWPPSPASRPTRAP